MLGTKLREKVAVRAKTSDWEIRGVRCTGGSEESQETGGIRKKRGKARNTASERRRTVVPEKVLSAEWFCAGKRKRTRGE